MQLPIRMLSAVLGLPDEDATQLFDWADAVIYNADPDYSDLISDRDDTSRTGCCPFARPSAWRCSPTSIGWPPPGAAIRPAT